MAVLNFTSREFRSQQAHVFELADQGEKVIIRRKLKITLQKQKYGN